MRRQFAGLLSSRGLASGLQAVSLVLLARQVSTGVFGVVSVVTAVVGMALVLTGLGLVVYVPQARARGEDGLVSGALRLNAWSSALTAVVLAAGISVWLGATGGPAGAALIALSLALERNIETYLGVSIGDGDSRTVAVSVLLRRTIALATFGTGLLLGVDPVWAYAGGLVVGASVAQVHVWRAVRPVLDVPAQPIGAVARRSSPYLLAFASAQVRTLDVAVVGAVLTPAATGLYAAASRLVQPLLLVPQSIAAVVGPRSTQLTGREARSLAGKLVLLFLGALVVGSPAIIWAGPLIGWLMGPDFADAGPALAWLLAGLPLLAMSSTYVAILQGQGLARPAAINAAVFGGLLLVAVALGAAWWGPAGAAIGLDASYLLRVTVLAVMVIRLEADRSPEVPSDG